jgi:hypothetical protein
MILLLFSGLPATGITIVTVLPGVESALYVNTTPLEWLVHAGGGWSVEDSGEWPAEANASSWSATSSPSTLDADGGDEWEVR